MRGKFATPIGMELFMHVARKKKGRLGRRPFFLANFLEACALEGHFHAHLTTLVFSRISRVEVQARFKCEAVICSQSPI